MSQQQELLEAAVRCYLRASAEDDACRCFERLGAWGEAGVLHENAGRRAAAATAFERARRFLDAARCHRVTGSLGDEARCLALGGEPFRAAWVLAHELSRFAEARAMVVEASSRGPADTTAGALVRARCHVGRGERALGARTLREAMGAIADVPAGAPRERAIAWALAVSEALRRPDLGALVLAGAAALGARVEATWDEWAARTLGAAAPPPFALDEGGMDSEGVEA